MSRTIAILELATVAPTLRLGSPPSQPALLEDRHLGGVSLLSWLIKRLATIAQLDDMAILADASHRDFIRTRVGEHFPVLSYAQHDPLARWAELARATAATAVVRIVPGHPFVDPELVRQLILAASRRSPCDYAGYFVSSGRRSLLSRIGMIAEWMSVSALLEAESRAVDVEDRGDASRYIHSHPDLFHVRLLPLQPPYDCRDVRLSLEHPEDWEHAQLLYESLGDEGLSWPAIADLVRRKQVLRTRMSQLNRLDRV